VACPFTLGFLKYNAYTNHFLFYFFWFVSTDFKIFNFPLPPAAASRVHPFCNLQSQARTHAVLVWVCMRLVWVIK
jgi:hypothetical protein